MYSFQSQGSTFHGIWGRGPLYAERNHFLSSESVRFLILAIVVHNGGLSREVGKDGCLRLPMATRSPMLCPSTERSIKSHLVKNYVLPTEYLNTNTHAKNYKNGNASTLYYDNRRFESVLSSSGCRAIGVKTYTKIQRIPPTPLWTFILRFRINLIRGRREMALPCMPPKSGQVDL